MREREREREREIIAFSARCFPEKLKMEFHEVIWFIKTNL